MDNYNDAPTTTMATMGPFLKKKITISRRIRPISSLG